MREGNLKQQSYWNSVANKKNFNTALNFSVLGNYVDKDADVLDIGCGYGRTLEELGSLGFRSLHGIDFSESMIERGKKNNSSLNLKVASATDTGFEDNSFDLVIMLSVLTCIVQNDEQKKVINEIRRILKPEGLLLIDDFLLNTDSRNKNRYDLFEEKYGNYGIFELEGGAVLRHHSMENISVLLQDFEELYCSKYVKKTMNGHESNAFYYIGRVK